MPQSKRFESEAGANPQPIDREATFWDNLGRQFVKAERKERRSTFCALRRQIGRVAAFSMDAHGTTQSYHSWYVDDELDVAERNVFFSAFNFPGLGNITRLIVNDIKPAPDFYGRSMAIQDYVIASASNVFTLQQSTLHMLRGDAGWKLPPHAGPLILPRADHLDLLSGASYNINLPKLTGWPTPLEESVIKRTQLEEATDILQNLSVSTFQPGFKNEIGF